MSITSIPIEENKKIFFSNAIFRAISNDMPEVIYENNLPTDVGSGLFRWNFINRNLSDEICSDFEVAIEPRGSWKILLIRDKETNFSFSVMSEKNFSRLQNSTRERMHYLDALLCVNKLRKPIAEQLSLFPYAKTPWDVSILENLRNQLLRNFSGIVEEHILVLFNAIDFKVTSVRAVLLTPKMEIVASDDWTSYLKSTFIPKESVLDMLSDNDDALVKLKPQFDLNNKTIVSKKKTDSKGKDK